MNEVGAPGIVVAVSVDGKTVWNEGMKPAGGCYNCRLNLFAVFLLKILNYVFKIN